ncbi:MAG TPA: FG-GAP-like repeat-containing protein [Planctomycetaceae bacterium]|nr:FG-GAP-like repeat-containing protein [Planctomycetaceae bacterium]
MNYFRQFLLILKEFTSHETPQRRGRKHAPRLEPLEVRVMHAGEFTDLGSAGIVGVQGASVSWGDYDNDGDLDAAVGGWSGSGPLTAVYQNDGSGNFTDINASLAGVAGGSVDWGDYDADGKLDLLVTGLVATVYHNDGNGVFTDINAGLTSVVSSSAAWGDYDNDGLLDIVIAGNSGGGHSTTIYHNEGDGTFSDINAGLTGLAYGSVAWGDYDGDGLVDLVLNGRTDSSNYATRLYHNDGDGDFTEVSAGLTDTSAGTLAWGDYDNDGDLDLASTGRIISGHFATIYRNDGSGTFTDIAPGLIGSSSGSVSWGDYDNDGSLDLLVDGDGSTGWRAKVYHNDGNDTFTDINAGLENVNWSSSAWGDYDGDADLDILLTGYNGSPLGKIYRNNATTANTAPDAPTALSAVALSSTAVTLSWTAATDTETDDDGLSYNLRVGTTPGGDDVFSSMANPADGFRRVASAGPIQGTSYTLTGLTAGTTYYWSVQAIDAGFMGSEFAAEATHLSFFSDLGNSGMIGVASGEAQWGDYDNDGDLDALVVGVDINGSAVASVYQNDGSGAFVDLNAGLTGVYYGAAAWGDYDNDGRLDILITGEDYYNDVSTKLYHNDGGGTFTEVNAGLINVMAGSVAWGDYNNDGQLDLFLSGLDDNVDPTAKLYHNNGDGTFTDTNANLEGATFSAAAWADIDNDGRVDLTYTGIAGSGIDLLAYHNNGDGTFTDLQINVSGVYRGSIAWGDYDNDGDLDLALEGVRYGTPRARIYRNNGQGDFTNIMAGLSGTGDGSVAWGDYDNDGDLDLVHTGYDGSNGLARIYNNDGNDTFTDAEVGFQGADYSSTAWGDSDGDGDLDLLLTGLNDNGDPVIKVYGNDSPTANTAPAAPTALLTAADTATSRTLSWTAAIDTETVAAGLSYNLRVGTTPGGSDVFTTMADTSSGTRRLASPGPIQGTSYTLTGLTSGVTYYWSVQAIDTGLAGGSFATEDSFEINTPPVVTPQDFLIGENSVNGAFIGTMVATDAEASQTKTFAITAGNTNNAFAIDAATGVLSVNNTTALNYETIQQFNLTVTVTDNGSPALSGSAAVRVYLRDENDSPVVTPKQFLIGENSVNTAYIGVVPVTDQDSGQTHTYSIVAGNTNNAFAINPTTGVLSVNNTAALDYETIQRFDLVVRVVDNGVPAAAGAATVTVFLRDMNDAPVVKPTQFLIGENSVNNAFIGNVPASDQDAGQTKTYSIVAGNVGNAFAISASTGVLTVNNSAALDYESIPRFDLTVRVVDNGNPAAAGSAITTVFLRNENDAPVVIAQDFLISENSVDNAFIGTIAAYDQDAGQTRTFAITGGNTNNAFAIHPTTGVLSVNNSAAVNFEAGSQFNLTVTVTDNGSPARSGSAAVRVFLRDVNEAPAVVAQNFLISENSVNNAYIGVMVANDPDAGQSKTFAITDGNTGNAFSIEPTTGILRVNNSAALDFETTPQFNLTITATDNGNPALSNSAPVTVFLRDVVGARPARIAAEDTTTVVVPAVKKTAGNFLARYLKKSA